MFCVVSWFQSACGGEWNEWVVGRDRLARSPTQESRQPVAAITGRRAPPIVVARAHEGQQSVPQVRVLCFALSPRSYRVPVACAVSSRVSLAMSASASVPFETRLAKWSAEARLLNLEHAALCRRQRCRRADKRTSAAACMGVDGGRRQCMEWLDRDSSCVEVQASICIGRRSSELQSESGSDLFPHLLLQHVDLLVLERSLE